MRRKLGVGKFLLIAGLVVTRGSAQTPLTWQQIKDKFEASNPTLKAAQASIAESRASEVTAFLRPNPSFSLSVDGVQVTPNGAWRPLSGVVETPGLSYLHERQGKRELRLESAKKSTDITVSTYTDQERGLLFNLRSGFVQTLQAMAVLQNAKENLAYWDKELTVSRHRFDVGDIAKVDLNRLLLQRVQFESDYETALVNVRTAKIQLLTLLNDRTPLDRFEVAGPYEYSDRLMTQEEFRNAALAARPDLAVAVENVDLAKINHRLAVANGSSDPTFGVWYSRNPSFSNPFANETMGGNISFPIRIFDRNQGEKARTQIDISRNQKLLDAAQAQVFSDVDSAYVTMVSVLNLLHPYKETYLPLATETRDQMEYSFKNGGASLLDYLDAEKAYRDTRLAYLNLIGSYLTAAAQMNMAVGREVIP
jgi:outer membrane protein, heavy metal efflux system